MKIPNERMSRAERSLIERLKVEAADVARYERLAAGAKRRRALLLCKLVRSGLSPRQLEEPSGLSNVSIYNALRKHEDG